MCFAQQRRALFRHLNFQKWSGAGVLSTFWVRNVLSTTTACTFSTSQLPKVVRSWCVFYILSSKCASFHNGVELFISHLASGLRTRRFSEPNFRPSGATNHWKTQCLAAFLPFRTPGSSFFWDFLFLIFFLLLFSSLLWPSLTLPISAFHLSILSEVWLLNFLRFTHELPEATYLLHRRLTHLQHHQVSQPLPGRLGEAGHRSQQANLHQLIAAPGAHPSPMWAKTTIKWWRKKHKSCLEYWLFGWSKDLLGDDYRMWFFDVLNLSAILKAGWYHWISL